MPCRRHNALHRANHLAIRVKHELEGIARPAIQRCRINRNCALGQTADQNIERLDDCCRTLDEAVRGCARAPGRDLRRCRVDRAIAAISRIHDACIKARGKGEHVGAGWHLRVVRNAGPCLVKITRIGIGALLPKAHNAIRLQRDHAPARHDAYLFERGSPAGCSNIKRDTRRAIKHILRRSSIQRRLIGRARARKDFLVRGGRAVNRRLRPGRNAGLRAEPDAGKFSRVNRALARARHRHRVKPAIPVQILIE